MATLTASISSHPLERKGDKTHLCTRDSLSSCLSFLHLLDTDTTTAGSIVLLGVFRGSDFHVGISYGERRAGSVLRSGRWRSWRERTRVSFPCLFARSGDGLCRGINRRCPTMVQTRMRARRRRSILLQRIALSILAHSRTTSTPRMTLRLFPRTRPSWIGSSIVRVGGRIDFGARGVLLEGLVEGVVSACCACGQSGALVVREERALTDGDGHHEGSVSFQSHVCLW
jgi:hypothetical protein